MGLISGLLSEIRVIVKLRESIVLETSIVLLSMTVILMAVTMETVVMRTTVIRSIAMITITTVVIVLEGHGRSDRWRSMRVSRSRLMMTTRAKGITLLNKVSIRGTRTTQ